MSDLQEVIARLRPYLKALDPGFRVIFDAAEAAEKARDAALEEAAKVAENACLVPPDGGEPTDAERDVCKEAARQIRALRRTA